jgi:hypothetical protein
VKLDEDRKDFELDFGLVEGCGDCFYEVEFMLPITFN